MMSCSWALNVTVATSRDTGVEIPYGLASCYYSNTCISGCVAALNLQRCPFHLREQTAVNNSESSLVKLTALHNYTGHVKLLDRANVKNSLVYESILWSILPSSRS